MPLTNQIPSLLFVACLAASVCCGLDWMLDVDRFKNGDTFSVQGQCLPCNSSGAYTYSARCAGQSCCSICKCRRSGTFVVNPDKERTVLGKCEGNPTFHSKVLQNPHCSFHIGGEAPQKIFRMSVLTATKLGIVTRSYNYPLSNKCVVLNATVWNGTQWIVAPATKNPKTDFEIKDTKVMEARGRNMYTPILYFYGNLASYEGRLVRVNVKCPTETSCIMFKARGFSKYFVREPLPEPTTPPPTTQSTPTTPAETTPSPGTPETRALTPFPIPLPKIPSREPSVEENGHVRKPEVIIRRPNPKDTSDRSSSSQNILVFIFAAIAALFGIGFIVMAYLVLTRKRRNRLASLGEHPISQGNEVVIKETCVNQEMGIGNAGFQPDPRKTSATPSLVQPHYAVPDVDDYETVDYEENLYQTVSVEEKKSPPQVKPPSPVDKKVFQFGTRNGPDVLRKGEELEKTSSIQYGANGYAFVGGFRERPRSRSFATGGTPKFPQGLMKALSEDNASEHYQTISPDYQAISQDNIARNSGNYWTLESEEPVDARSQNASQLQSNRCDVEAHPTPKLYESPSECLENRDSQDEIEAMYQMPLKD